MGTVENLLKQAGYYEERSVDISEIMHMYEEYGYRCSHKQKEFVQKYANLEIHYNHPIWKEDMILRLNPIEAQKVITMDIIEKYNEFLQDNLLIIGDIEEENLTVFLSEKGFYFTMYDDCVINWGNDFEVMLYNLISGNRGELQIID